VKFPSKTVLAGQKLRNLFGNKVLAKAKLVERQQALQDYMRAVLYRQSEISPAAQQQLRAFLLPEAHIVYTQRSESRGDGGGGSRGFQAVVEVLPQDGVHSI
jgi:hypothetical protein